MLKLSNISLVTVDGSNPELCVKSLNISCRGIEFKEILLITYKRPDNITSNIKLILIDKLSYMGYNDFVVHKLSAHVNSEYCLLTQPDGFVLNPSLWTEEFLKYDYIGAPWLMEEHRTSKWVSKEAQKDYNQVGNGGFSLRSKKFLDISSSCPEICDNQEDVYVCNNNKKFFLGGGVLYAPVHIALKFSQDPLPNRTSTFGFHGDKSIINNF